MSRLRNDTEMLGHPLRNIGILLLFCLAMGAPACADGPAAKFRLLEDKTVTSSDRQVRVEQYATDLGDEGFLHQFWAFDSDHQHGSLLNPGEGTDLAGYPAGFRFSPNSQWLVRMQKLGAGYQTLFLYRRDRVRLTSATAKPLGDLAWDYFFSLPVSKRMHRDPKDRYSLDHAQAILLKGLDENYAWLGQKWPDSRYLVISLSFDVQGEEKPTPWIEGWRCLYDMKTGAFSVPSEFSGHNAKAIKSPRSPRG
jgi:hypothetical protein